MLRRQSFDTSVPTVLVRLDRNPFHHGTLGAVRSLGRAGIPVHAVIESSTSPVTRSRYLRSARASPGTTSSTELVTLLHGIADEVTAGTAVESADGPSTPLLVLPLDDVSALALARRRAELSPRFLLPHQTEEQLLRVADKAALAETCADLGLPHPRTELPVDADEAAAMAWSLGLPVVAKWSRPWLLPAGGGLRSTSIVRSLPEVRELYARTPEAGSRLLLQRLLLAGRDLDWFFHGYVDTDGRCTTGATGRKERSWPDGAGLTAVGRWTANPAVDRTARELFDALGYRGVCDLDFRLDRSTGAYHLLDFNPRPGAQFRLFTDPDGLDVVRALHLDLTGRPVPPYSPAYGRRFVVENYAALSLLTSPRRRSADETATGEAPRLTEYAWCAADDPVPAFAMGRAWLGHLLRKALTALRELLRSRRARPTPAPPSAPPPARSSSNQLTPR
ncbi:ATP-grasp domain-containing protein [Streptomyces sp. NBC_00572]|uniref:carboxylate--amine ligase n=1 Tax=Streptomyces sp. NBC_00572 TaxID=2903664 RepID=UPI00225713D6|nr:ATP-grasp domain-containing protein [Streptomyces sp. NBC_00572]MCX4983110.1 ATP-grasp domain-containing protein [Streptomyces sp. NBC_00572]